MGILGVVATFLFAFSSADGGIVFEIRDETFLRLTPSILFVVGGIAVIRWGWRALNFSNIA